MKEIGKVNAMRRVARASVAGNEVDDLVRLGKNLFFYAFSVAAMTRGWLFSVKLKLSRICRGAAKHTSRFSEKSSRLGNK